MASKFSALNIDGELNFRYISCDYFKATYVAKHVV